MPTYEYQCNKCKNRFEEIRTVKDRDKYIKCPECDYLASRVPTSAGIRFKGDWETNKSQKSRRNKQLPHPSEN